MIDDVIDAIRLLLDIEFLVKFANSDLVTFDLGSKYWVIVQILFHDLFMLEREAVFRLDFQILDE